MIGHHRVGAQINNKDLGLFEEPGPEPVSPMGEILSGLDINAKKKLALHAPGDDTAVRFEKDGVGANDPHDEIQRAGILGSEAFMERVLDHVDRQALSPEIVRKDRPAPSLEVIAQRHQTRDPTIQEAYSTGAYTITEIAESSTSIV
mgnify:CR=1 FL=1